MNNFIRRLLGLSTNSRYGFEVRDVERESEQKQKAYAAGLASLAARSPKYQAAIVDVLRDYALAKALRRSCIEVAKQESGRSPWHRILLRSHQSYGVLFMFRPVENEVIAYLEPDPFTNVDSRTPDEKKLMRALMKAAAIQRELSPPDSYDASYNQGVQQKILSEIVWRYPE